MNLGTKASRTRCLLVWATITATAALLMAGLRPVLAEAAQVAGRQGLATVGFDVVLVWGCAVAALAVTAWLWLVATLVTLDAARGVPTARRGVPVFLRSAVLVLCGAALTTGLAAPAVAGGTTSTKPPQQLAGLQLPERIAVSPAAHPEPGPTREPVTPTVARAAAAGVVVAPGDTLWDLAARHLGPHPTAQETAAAWPAIYALNREVIGPDPGLIEPGQRLLLPPAGADGAGR